MQTARKVDSVSAPYTGGTRRPDGTYAAPRRYSIALMMIVTTAFAALLTAVRAWFDLGPEEVIAIFSFFVMVGVGQSVLFGGNNPRRASMICGAAAMPATTILLYAGDGDVVSIFGLMCMLIVFTLVGAPAGYLAGGLIAGVFLICDQAAAVLFPSHANRSGRDASFDEIVGPGESDVVEAEIVE